MSSPKSNGLNTVYIISKGRPSCTTAQTLTKMGYPGEWYIVCGNNDETIGEYKDNWGDHVIEFDWYDEITRTDTLDNFGFEKMASGAVPVRNATCDIARARGEKRHWQLDDDYSGFYRVVKGTMKKERMDGEALYEVFTEISEFAHRCGLSNAGIALGTIESHPAQAQKFGKRVFNAHNLPTDTKLLTRWRGRMNDDLINAIETYRNGGFEMLFKYANLTMEQSQAEQGGLTDLYQAEGTVRKSAYPVLLAPNAAKLTIKFGRYHHTVDWKKLVPKMLSGDWRRGIDG